MKKNFLRVRRWLERNRVIFETAAASLLSLMAIIVSIAQTCTTIKQTALLGMQTRITEAQALPQFEVAIHQKLNNESGKYDDDILQISNRGGPVHDLSANSACFLRVKIHKGIAGESTTEAEFPLNGYFDTTMVSVAGIGQLMTMTGYHNNAKFIDLERGTSKLAEARKWSFALVDLRIVLRLRYRDLLDREHEDYYEVQPVTGGTRIAKAPGIADFARWEKGRPLELSSLRADNLLSLVARPATGAP